MSVQAPAPARAAWPGRVPGLHPTTRADDLRTLLGATVAIFLMIFWAVDDGGFDPTTWYWGALLTLAALTGVLIAGRRGLSGLPRALKLALGLLAAYVAWSYLSMTWAAYPGLALQGSNRTLLFAMLFSLVAVLPWRRATALLAITVFAVGIGAIAVALLMRFALGDHISAMFLGGRLVYPTGYFNSTAALFTIGALVSVALAARRGPPGALRGLLLALASADLMLAVTVQSRGWLFTLPLVGLYAALVCAGRVRTVAHALLPAAATLAVIHPLLRLFQYDSATLTHDAVHAGKLGLLSCAAVFGIGTLAAWLEIARDRPALAPAARRALGTAAVVLTLVGLGVGLVLVSGGHPAQFVSHQWHGFTSEPANADAQTHFTQVGSGRYDIWRSAAEAFRAHPIGGLGQDNFGDWYLTHRHTREEPLWAHSLEMQLLASTGAVGLLLFLAFLVAALGAALGNRRAGELTDRMLVGAALLPLGVWLIHGSIDWFWQIPALSGPALGFLAMAARLRPETASAVRDPVLAPAPGPARLAPGLRRALIVPAGGLALVAATIALGLPYLALRELSFGESASHTDVAAALADFRSSHRLDPLMSDPGVLGGSLALVNGRDAEAAGLFRQAIAREPGQWVAWLGRGLAASAQGQVDEARRAFRVALRLDSDQAVIRTALRRVGTHHPLGPQQAFSQIDYEP